MEKRYKIKEDCKKYFGEHFKNQMGTLDFFKDNDITLEALEEVEERMEIVMHRKDKFLLYKMENNSAREWTEQERDLIEFVVNEFDSFTDFFVSLNDFGTDCFNNGRELTPCKDIEDWLKQRKH